MEYMTLAEYKRARGKLLAEKDDAERQLLFQLRLEEMPAPVPQCEFAREATGRRWRADFAWPDPEIRLLVEIDGGAWTQGRHNRGAGFIEDMAKLNAAAHLGYFVLRFTPGQVHSGEALAEIERFIDARIGAL